MNTAILTTLFLAPAALVAAAPAPLSPAATQQLAEVEELFTTRLLDEADKYRSSELAGELRNYVRECREVIEHFRRTGDARHRSALRHQSLLHLACSAKKVELVQELLAAGADPNALVYEPAFHREYDGAFTLSLAPILGDDENSPRPDRDTCLRLIDLLVAAGGDATSPQAADALTMHALIFGHFEGGEDLALRLLELGTDPGKTTSNDVRDDEDVGRIDAAEAHRHDFLAAAARQGWHRVVERQAGRLRDIDGAHGRFTLLGTLVRDMVEQADRGGENENFEARAACIALLLRQGASPSAKHRGWGGGESVADLIHSHPRLLAYLGERGFSIPRTPRELGEYTLARDVKELPALACPPIETLAPLFDKLAALLAHESAERQQEKLVRLLLSVDGARTADALMALPHWQGAQDWTPPEQRLAQALHRFPELARALPADWLVECAAKREATGHPRDAHALIALLAQQPGAAPLVEKLCGSDRPAIAAAAWTARLRLAGWDNLPLLDIEHLLPPGSEDAATLHRLRHALDLLTNFDSGTQAFYLDFSKVDDFWSAQVKRADKPEDRPTDKESMEELLSLLRRRGARNEADALSELYELYRHLHPGIGGNEWLAAGRKFFSGIGKEEREARFAELTRPEKVEPTAFAVEALVGRYVWELYQKNAK